MIFLLILLHIIQAFALFSIFGMPQMKILNHLAIVNSTGRVLCLTKQLGEDRWLCTDFKQQCHPCYNLKDLTIFPIEYVANIPDQV
jgi:hypothetical protein